MPEEDQPNCEQAHDQKEDVVNDKDGVRRALTLDSGRKKAKAYT